jgi:heat shock protein HslJ
MDDIVDIVWTWIEMQDAEGRSLIADPENYVLVFHTDGTLNVMADCNTGHATYTLEEDRLTLGPIALTKMMCAKGSRSDQFVQMLDLADTVAIDPETGNLIITLKDQAGALVFAEAGKPKMPIDRCDYALDVVWMWERFEDTAGENSFAVDDPSKYTLKLLTDDTFSFEADCNVGSGTYTCCCGNSITLQLGPTTLAECGPDSLYDGYMDKLGDVAGFVLDEGKLVLNLMADAGNMVFTRQD